MQPDPKLHVNLLRLDERQRAEVLRRLDPGGSAGRARDHERRREPRWIFRRSDVVVELEQPGGSLSRFLVLARNLSANGLAFIHGGFVYSGTRGQVLLPRVEGPSQLVGIAVVGCRHVDGPLHEVRVQFAEAIQPREFLHFDQLMDGLPADAASVGELHGKALLVAGEATTIKMLRHALTPTRISLALAEHLGEARQLIERGQRFDLLLLDLPADRDAALRSVDELRRMDLDPPLTVLASDRGGSTHTTLMWEGADHVLRKPVRAEALYEVLLRLNRQRRSFAA
jgi:CheY-like chemotaxis protein